MPNYYKPTWVAHDNRSALSSLDIHPDGKRFATASIDHTIRIWNLEPVIFQDKQDDPDVDRLLCTLTSHQKPVNTVRWSPNGRYLASASDDATVVIWGLRSESAIDSDDVESWAAIHIFRGGHEGDVFDIAWSPDSTLLASAGVDDKIAVWDVEKKKLVRHLEGGGQGIIKGLAWDPTGRFLAAQGDRSVCIWRVNDGVLDRAITRPFKKSPSTSLYKRLSWTPDGAFLVASSGMKNGKHVAPIVQRGDWTTEKDFVGHVGPVVSARFNPTVFVEDRAPFLCCALGGQDHLVSIWATKTPRAIVVLQNMFEQTVNDLAWTSDGLHLLMCSTDGTVGLATFKEGELGTRMPEEDFQSHIKTLYGDIAMGTPYRPAMVETPDLLDASSNGARQRNNTGLAPQRRSAVGSSTFAFSTRATTPEKTVAKVVASDSQSQQVSFTTGTRVVSQIMTSLPNGRKRIIPQHISMPPPAELPAPVRPVAPSTPKTPNASSGTTPTTPSTQVAPRSVLTSPITFAAVPVESPALREDEESRKRKREEEEAMLQKKKKGLDASKKRKFGEEDELFAPVPSFAAPVRLPSLEKKDRYLVQLHDIKNGPVASGSLMYTADVLVEVNVSENLNGVISTVVCTMGPTVLWQDRIRERVVKVTGNPSATAIATESGKILVYSPAGRRIVTLAVGSGLSYLEASKATKPTTGACLAAVACTGETYVWNTKLLSLVCKTSVMQLLSPDMFAGAQPNPISRVSVDDNGVCTVVLASGDAFAYNQSLDCWVEIFNAIFTTSPLMSTATTNPGSLADVAREATRLNPFAATRAVSLSAEDQRIEQLSIIESQLSGAIVLQSQIEYLNWMRMYVRKLVEFAAERKLEELFSELLGSPTCTKQWSPTIVGLQKRQVLKDLLPLLTANLQLQRMLARYREDLELTNAHG